MFGNQRKCDVKKILLFSRDPGGANTVIPLVGTLSGRGYEVRLFGKDTALKKYSKAGLNGIDIMGFVNEITQDSIEEFLLSENPDFIITGTSASDFTEKHLWKTSEKLNIPSFAILDQWINYGIRFSRYSTTEIEEYREAKSHEYLPTKILVMDEFAKGETIKDGIEPSRILVTGQPYFETLLKEKEKITSSQIDKIKRKLNLNLKDDDFIITFASEPVSIDYANTDYWGFTEKTIFAELVAGVNKISAGLEKRIAIIIRPHPREKEDNFNEIICNLDERINIVIDRNSSSIELISLSDIVAGMSSMFLIEALILGKPVLSILIGMNKERENPFILSRRGITKSVKKRDELVSGLHEIIIEGKKEKNKFDFIRNPVSNIISYMEKYLCQN